jgi:hypothetical protein
LTVPLYDSKTYSITLREERELGVFETKCPQKYFDLWGENSIGNVGYYISRNFMTYSGYLEL